MGPEKTVNIERSRPRDAVAVARPSLAAFKSPISDLEKINLAALGTTKGPRFS